jgi:hypothetical protein
MAERRATWTSCSTTPSAERGAALWGDLRGDNAIEQLVPVCVAKVDQGGTRPMHTRRGFGYWLGRAEAEG